VRPPGRPAVAALGAALVFAAATPWVLRPWFLAHDALPHWEGPASAMVDADLHLNVWILAWIAHAAVHAPAHLLDGNIHYPAPHTILGSENMLAHLPVSAPVLAATGNAVHVLKAVALESFVAVGLAMWLLVRFHTRDAAAALVAGAAATFTTFRVESIPQPQYLGTQYLVLALLAVDAWCARGRRRALAGLAAALALQALACVYVGYFAFLLVPVYAAVRLAGGPPGALRRALPVALAIAAGAALVLPAAVPYARALAAGTVPRQSLEVVSRFVWPPWWYLSPAVLPKVGVVAAALVAADLLLRLSRRARAAAPRPIGPEPATWAVVGAAVLLSAGPYLYLHVPGQRWPSPYLLLYRWLPGFSTIRAPARFFVVVALGLAALAGYAFARWTAGWPRLARGAAAGALALLAAVAAAPRPAPVMRAHLGADAPAVYRWLAAEPGPGAVVEVPGALVEGDVIGNLRNARYEVASTIHWHPLVNGYTAYAPPTAGFFAALTRRLPDPAALAALIDAVDVRWIVLHRGDLTPSEAVPWRTVATPGLALAARFGDDEVWAVTARPTHDRRSEIVARGAAPQPRTLAGTPIAPLAPSCRAARVLAVVPPPAMVPAPLPVAVPVRFANDGDCTWPAFDVRPEGLVGLTYRWVSPSGERFPDGPFTRLAADVPPRTVVDDTMLLAPPSGELGRWTAEVALVQRGMGVPLARARATVELQPWPAFTAERTM
jgi:hypothetical protein